MHTSSSAATPRAVTMATAATRYTFESIDGPGARGWSPSRFGGGGGGPGQHGARRAYCPMNTLRGEAAAAAVGDMGARGSGDGGGGGGLPGGRDPAGRCRRPRLRGPGRSTRTYKLTLPQAVSGSTARPPVLRDRALFGRRRAPSGHKDILPRRPLYTTLFIHTHRTPEYIILYAYISFVCVCV